MQKSEWKYSFYLYYFVLHMELWIYITILTEVLQSSFISCHMFTVDWFV
jgi:hypothetical protein